MLELLPTTRGIEGLIADSPAALRALGLEERLISALKSPDPDLLAQDQAWLASHNHHVIGIDDPDYPALLRRIPDPPALLYVAGDPSALWQPQVGVVGSRNPTGGGRDHARDFAGTLSRDGWTITSGLAAGIDVTAHLGALDAGGLTIAVLGTGADVVYPTRHGAISERIAQNGALITELPPGTPPRKSHFPSRNRIIAGLSLGVLVVEAALNSGSLITARLAGEQGREVFALPGSLHNPMARGCHRLIRQGARLVESTADMTPELAPLAAELALALRQRLAEDEHPDPEKESVSAPDALDDPDYQRLWDALGFDPVTQDQLVERSGLEARAVSSMLLILELRGLVTTETSGRVMRNSS